MTYMMGSGPDRHSVEGGWGQPLPHRTPGRIEDAETVRTTPDDPAYDQAAEDFRRRWDNSQHGRGADAVLEYQEPVITALEGANTPPWNRFDTFLRRALMIGGAIIIWLAIVTSVLVMFGSAFLLSKVGGTADQLTNPPAYEQPILPGETEPAIDPCETDPEYCGTGN